MSDAPKPAAPAGPLTYTLLHPVELQGKDGELLDTVRQLVLHRLTGKSARAVINAQARGPGDFMFELLCASARIPPSTFDKLDAEDILLASEKAAPFFGECPANLTELQADLAYVFKWQPSELNAMPVADVLMWHAQVDRIGKELKNAK